MSLRLAKRNEPAGGASPRPSRSLPSYQSNVAVLRTDHRVGSKIEIKDIDFDCLDVIIRHGPISPTALARRVGVHLATMTGILARLESSGSDRTRSRGERPTRGARPRCS